MSKEAMKLALEALEYIEHNYMSLPAPAEKAITALREALAEPDFWEGYVPEPDKRQQALDKKAENARELGLDYEPAQDSGIVTAGGFDPRTQRTWVGLREDEIYSVLENLQVMHHRPPTTDSRVIFALAVEAKLKEKNT